MRANHRFMITALLPFAVLLAMIPGGSPQAATGCPTGFSLNYGFRLESPNFPVLDTGGNVCSPTSANGVRVGSDATGGVGVAAGGIGASVGAGAISAAANSFVSASATGSTNIEFKLVKTDPTLPNFVAQPIGYDVEVITLQASFDLTSPSTGSLVGKGFVNIFAVDDFGQLISAGGVPTDHRNGVDVSLTEGSILTLSDPSVTVQVGRTHVARFGGRTVAFVSSQVGIDGIGSAAAQISLGVSGRLIAPEGYAFEFVGAAPFIGAYPTIALPLTHVPLPSAIVVFGSGLLGLLAVRRRRSPASSAGTLYRSRANAEAVQSTADCADLHRY